MIYHKPGITLREETILLIVFGCVLSAIVSFSIIWGIQLILAINNRQYMIKTQEEFDLLSDLEGAIERNELVLYFQPQANLVTDELVGMETLLRWQHPKKGLIMPDIFIPLAEKSGLIGIIGEWAILQACIYNKKLLMQGYNLRVGVNISQLQFKSPFLVEHISRVLNVTQLPAQNLELEITETAMMEDIEYAIKTMHQLRELGLILSLDDFGTGYSSLAQLDRLPIHKLKIDKAFVQSLNYTNVTSSMAFSIIQLGHKLNLQIAVEGIENAQQKGFFAELDCHEAQGFHIGAPIPADKFVKFLSTARIRRYKS
ncbi:MAG TPA: EAL domain-containing protein [Gammaproteobacteria bacterium]|nr:EAL domain-containing protein [Gammaproteobacteria bacterium]